MELDQRARIIEAAARLLGEQGAEAVTTRAVAQAAGVQPPTIYRLFGDKDGLVDAVAEHVMATYVASKAPDVEGDPVADLHAGWELHVRFGLAHPELQALLNAPGRLERSPATAAGIDVLRRRVRRIAAAGQLRVDEQRALDVIHAAGTGTVAALLSTPAGERDPDLPEAMWRAVAAAILSDASAAPEDGLVPAAVLFATVLPDLPALTDAERTLMAEWLARSLSALRETQASAPVTRRAASATSASS